MHVLRWVLIAWSVFGVAGAILPLVFAWDWSSPYLMLLAAFWGSMYALNLVYLLGSAPKADE